MHNPTCTTRLGLVLLLAAGLSSCWRDSSGSATDSGDTAGPRAPEGLTVAYDTLLGRAHLSWRSVKDADLDGYLIFRNEVSLPDPVRFNVLVKDTFFIDTVFRDPLDDRDLELVYRVKAQDKGANPSPAYSQAVAIAAPSPLRVRTAFAFTLHGAQGDSTSSRDTVAVIAAYSNPTRRHAKVTWMISGEAAPVRTAAASGRSGVDTLRISWPDTGRHTVIAWAEDDAGSIWSDSVAVRVVRDAPRASVAGEPWTKVGSVAAFEARVTQAFGSVALYKWDDGKAPGWDDSGAAMASRSFVYQARGSYPVRLYVRDDDGNADSAQLTLAVSNENPVFTRVPRDTTLTVKDTLSLRFQAVDPDGIRAYLWDFDGDGTADDTTAGPETVHVFPATPRTVMVKVTALDEFDGRTVEGCVVKVILDPPSADAGRDTVVSVNDTLRVCGVASDGRGRIVRLEWSLGGGPWLSVSQPETTFVAPATESLGYRVVLRATDDDGNATSDTLAVQVERDPPVAVISGPEMVRVDSLFTLGSASSTPGRFGRLVKREWSLTGPGNFTAAPAGDTTLRAPSAETTWTASLRITDDDGNTTTTTKSIQVLRKWVAIGERGFSAGRADFPVLALSAGVPYLAYRDQANMIKPTVMRYDGSAWIPVGASGFSYSSITGVSLAVEGGVPYVAYDDNGRGMVMRYDGSNWVAVGARVVPAGAITNLTLAFSSGVPYVAYTAGDVSVRRFDGAEWVQVGAPNISYLGTKYISLAIAAGDPYVAYVDNAYGNGVTVKRFDGTNWVKVGGAGFSGGKSRYVSLAFDGNVPYVAYSDEGQAWKTIVRRFDGADWVKVGSEPGISVDATEFNSLVIASGVPYVAFRDDEVVKVMRFNGANWELVGGRPFPSGGPATYPSLAISSAGKPILGFQDGSNLGRATVVELK